MTEPSLKVLLVGERVRERDALALALGDHGFFPRVAATLELAAAAAHEQPDFVVIDAASLDAEQVRGLLSDASIGCSVLVLSDLPSVELGAFAARCGAAGCMGRAGPLEALATEVKQFVLRSRAAPGPGPEEVDFISLARRSTRAQFVAASPSPFLVSVSNLVSQSETKATANILDPEMFDAIQDAVHERLTSPMGVRYDTPRSNAIALAVRGRSDGAADRISLGRGNDVDVLIDHATISKHHAWFSLAPDGMRVSDAGSRNGTWLCGRLLKPNGRPSPVASGDIMRFGELEFTFLSSAAAWDLLRTNVR